jgi:hypothetical protein
VGHLVTHLANRKQIQKRNVCRTTFRLSSHDGSWRVGQTAGGCRNFLRSFASNPQYRIKLTDSDPNDEVLFLIHTFCLLILL